MRRKYCLCRSGHIFAGERAWWRSGLAACMGIGADRYWILGKAPFMRSERSTAWKFLTRSKHFLSFFCSKGEKISLSHRSSQLQDVVKSNCWQTPQAYFFYRGDRGPQTCGFMHGKKGGVAGRGPSQGPRQDPSFNACPLCLHSFALIFHCISLICAWKQTWAFMLFHNHHISLWCLYSTSDFDSPDPSSLHVPACGKCVGEMEFSSNTDY